MKAVSEYAKGAAIASGIWLLINTMLGLGYSTLAGYIFLISICLVLLNYNSK